MNFKKSMSLSLLLLTAVPSIHTVQIEWGLKPLRGIYALVTMQNLFNICSAGTIGWLVFDKYQSKKSPFDTGAFLTKQEAGTTYTTIKYHEQVYNEDLTPAFTKKLAAAVKTEFVTKEEHAVTIKRVDLLEDRIAEIAGTLLRLNQDVKKMVDYQVSIKDKIDPISQTLKEHLTSLESLKQGLQDLNKSVNQQFGTLDGKIDALPQNQSFIAALAPHVAGVLTKPDPVNKN